MDVWLAREIDIIIAVDINWIYYRNSIRGGIQCCCSYLSRLNYKEELSKLRSLGLWIASNNTITL